MELEYMLNLTIIYCIFLFIFGLRYRFPHHGIHFSGDAIITMEKLEEVNNCKEHDDFEIMKFKKRNLIYIKIGTIMYIAGEITFLLQWIF